MVTLTATGRSISSGGSKSSLRLLSSRQFLNINHQPTSGQQQQLCAQSGQKTTKKRRLKMKKLLFDHQHQHQQTTSGSSKSSVVSPVTLLACYEDSAFIYRPQQQISDQRVATNGSSSLQIRQDHHSSVITSSPTSSTSSSSLGSSLEQSSGSSGSSSSSYSSSLFEHLDSDSPSCISALDFCHLNSSSSSSFISSTDSGQVTSCISTSSLPTTNISTLAACYPQVPLQQVHKDWHRLIITNDITTIRKEDNKTHKAASVDETIEENITSRPVVSAPVEPPADPVYIEDRQVLENLILKESAELRRRAQLVDAAEKRGESAELLLRGQQRHSLLSWMLSVCEQQICQDEIFPLASMILDKFLLSHRHPLAGINEISANDEQLVERQLYLFGACSLLLASKLRQTPRLCIQSLLELSKPELNGLALSKEELLEGELLVLTVLKWDLAALVAPNDFLALILSKCKNSTQQTKSNSTSQTNDTIAMIGQHRLRRHTQTLLELCLMDTHLSQYPPSIMAMASMAVAIDGLCTTKKTCRRLEETVNQIHEATHKVNELKLMIDVAFQIEKYVQKLLHSTHND